eukprot:m.230299 g.230299  ORF g.230299 m.230299 type:complete len:806 (+) comp33577_c0_seq1:203-2620(+)
MATVLNGSGFTCVNDAQCVNVACSGNTVEQLCQHLEVLDSASCRNGSCECEPRALFFITFGMYLMAILGVAVYSRNLTKIHRMRSKEDYVKSAHNVMRDFFMPRAGFGYITMALTLFSGYISGYSLVGIPNEASEQGFVALRWLMLGVPMSMSMALYYPRFREVGLKRNYAAPSDIIADRFHCQSLRLLATSVMLFVMFVYAAAQFKAIYDVIDVIVVGRVNAKTLTFVIMAVLVVCDWTGGQRGVSLSDAIQAAIVLFSFITVPFFLLAKYKSMAGLASKLEISRPYALLTPTTTGDCDYSNRLTDQDCFENYYYREVANASSAESQYAGYLNRGGIDVDLLTDFDHGTLSMLGFVINGFSFPMQAPFLQKIFLARSARVVKWALIVITFGQFIVVLPSIYYGLLAGAEFPKEQVPAHPLLMGKLMNDGAVHKLVAVIALNAVLAAIMSTTDSAVIGACNVFSVAWVKGLLLRGKSPRFYKGVSMVFTAVFSVAAVVFATDERTGSFSSILNIQNSVNWQLLPTFTVALFTDRVAAHPLLYGMIVGLLVCIGLESKVSQDVNFQCDASQHYPDGRRAFGTILPSGVWGAIANVSVMALSQVLFNITGSKLGDDSKRDFDKPHADVIAAYGESRLTVKTICEDLVVAESEPYSQRLPRFLVILQIVLLVFGLPWYYEAYTKQPVIGSVPSWAVASLSTTVIAFAIQIYVFSRWQCTDHRPSSELTSNEGLEAIQAAIDDEDATNANQLDDNDDDSTSRLKSAKLSINSFDEDGFGYEPNSDITDTGYLNVESIDEDGFMDEETEA